MLPDVKMGLDSAGQEPFSGFADLYDPNRPSPPAALPLGCSVGVDDPSTGWRRPWFSQRR
jgi:hypothetical protein